MNTASNSFGDSFTDQDFLKASAAAEKVNAEPREAMQERPKGYGKLAFYLALATVISTFWAGAAAWVPAAPILDAFQFENLYPIRQVLLANWWGGLQFSLALMAILTAHELGHYIFTIVYRVPSTPPLFIPFPFLSPIGTMGAVIMMQSGTADRRQIFDIGIAGPLAGLVVAVPVILLGIQYDDPIRLSLAGDTIAMGQPLLIQWLAGWVAPERTHEFVMVSNTQASPLLMAGWVGLLVTGLNMMPLGQLDGGHVTFGLLGGKSFWIAVAALTGAILFMAYSRVWIFSLMILLVLLMGLRHPPSSNDRRTLGLGRQVLGWCTLTLPVLCIPANPIVML